mmetsp:Transcript_42164/g.117397  ORF Transcript_42164/g.117397 Transcript_42164/m.117397 type:complete len:272 (+) Transcript_42164:765-1580(+)
MLATKLCVKRHLSEGKREDKDDKYHQDPSVKDGTHSNPDPLDHDYQLWYAAQQLHHPRDPRQPDKPQQSQRSGISHALVTFDLCRDEDRGYDPSLEYQYNHQEKVKRKPRVLHHIPLVLEGQEAYDQLDGEEQTKEVVSHLEPRLSFVDEGGGVEVAVHCDPDRVDQDDNQGGVLEHPAPRNCLDDTVLVVVTVDFVFRPCNGLPYLLLHVVWVKKDTPAWTGRCLPGPAHTHACEERVCAEGFSLLSLRVTHVHDGAFRVHGRSQPPHGL